MNNNKYNNTYLGRIGNWISKGGHTLANGDTDVTISAKCDYMVDIHGSKYWKFLQRVVDFSFAPIDGEDHTGKAYDLDPDERYDIGVGLFQDIVCTFFILLVCPVVGLITYPIKLIRKLIK